MVNSVLENKRMLEEMHARVFGIYRRLPEDRKKRAQKLIDKWHEGIISYEELLDELEKLVSGNSRQ